MVAVASRATNRGERSAPGEALHMLPPTVPMVRVCLVHISLAVYPSTSISRFMPEAWSRSSSDAMAPMHTSRSRLSMKSSSGAQVRSIQ